ncbi:FAD-dependent oxidoreductase [Phosphitispora sp. TUW77]|uniref:FAD-dependent oxidoreductase n=1 Tax=Phosphitispora sp. TUW77 TaxID=3152361 RepID=UPI003AB3FEFD
MFTDANINLIVDKVTAIDVKSKNIAISTGENLSYDKLILATGSKPFVPPISGNELEGVFTLRTASDAETIQGYINSQQPKKLVFVGAGFLNLELAALLVEKNPEKYDITVVELLEHPLPLMLDKEMGQIMINYLKEQGFQLKFGQKATAMTGENGTVKAITLDNGETLDADMVVLSVGIRPELELAKEAGLEIGKLGIKVNEYMETSNPDILAGGDIIETEHFITKKPSASLLRGPAVIQGRLIAKRLAGCNISFPGVLNNSAVRIFNKYISAVGFNEDQAVKEGFSVLGVTVNSSSKHRMIPGNEPCTLKLVFDRTTQKLLGGQIISNAVAPVKEIDTINALILGGMTAAQMSTLMCAGNPDCSSEPSREPITLASEQALQKLK